MGIGWWETYVMVIFTRGDLGQFRWSRSMGAGMAWEETMAARRSVIQSVCGNFWIWWTMKSSSQSTRSASLRASPSPSFLIRAKLGWERRAGQDAIIVWRLTWALYKIVRSCQRFQFSHFSVGSWKTIGWVCFQIPVATLCFSCFLPPVAVFRYGFSRTLSTSNGTAVPCRQSRLCRNY